jgi:hypothetical protein
MFAGLSLLGYHLRGAEVLGAVVRRHGGALSTRVPAAPGAPFTHVVCDSLDGTFARPDAIRRAARAPASAPVLRREWVRMPDRVCFTAR